MIRTAMILTAALALGGAAHAAPKAPPAKVAAASAKPKPSGVLKAYKGPEGELIAMVEVNEGKEMLVYFKNLGGDLEGKSLLYLYEDLGGGTKNVYLNKKRGSKTYRSVLLSARDGGWSFYHPTKSGTQFAISYSEHESENMKIDDVVNAYKP